MMAKRLLIACGLLSGLTLCAQNDVDALRFSRIGAGGTPRSIAMGGAMGALGGDISCATTNPGALAIYRRGELIYSGGLRFTYNTSSFDGKNVSTPDGRFVFGNFGLSFAYNSEKDATKRNVFAFSNTQMLSFNSETQIHNSATRHSISGDMLNLANEAKFLSNMNSSYEYMGYYTYVLDYDSAAGKFFSFVDQKRDISLTRNLSTSGKMNEINISLAQSVDDKFYFGVSIGIPRIRFESITAHSEVDAQDSMHIAITGPNTFTSTYIEPLPYAYDDKLGFNSLTYKEHFRTDGYGVNLKLGGVFRISPEARIGAYFHTPTVLYLTDTYSYTMKATFDAATPTSTTNAVFPEETGKSIYRVTTPMRFGINAAYIVNKMLALALDVENVNYASANISSGTPSDFSGVNAVIKNKYKSGTNIRVGAELNVKPIMIRCGYNIYGSPFGGVFSGPFDRQTASIGLGYRTKSNLFFDVTWAKTFTKEQYYMYSTNPVKTDLSLSTTNFLVAVGLKF
jgi:long-subunit fatty acid transport protein